MANAGIPERLERLEISWLHRRLLILSGFGWLFDAMDVGMITFVLAALAKDWHLASRQIGLIGSAGLCGMFVGAVTSGLVADRLGRKAVFQITLLIFSVTTLFCALAWNVKSMMVFRFVIGCGLGGEMPVVSSLVSEFVPGHHRGKYIALLQSFWAVGSIVAALVATFVIPAHGWRIAFVIGAAPAFYIWVIRRAIPESPRWLESRGRTAEADAVMRTLEAENGRLTGRPFPQEGSPAEASSEGGQVPAAPPPPVKSLAAFRELWTGRYLKRTVMLWILWFCLLFEYYGVFVWLPTLLVKEGFSLVSSFGYVLAMTAAQLPGYVSAAFLVDRIGRRWVLGSYLVLAAVAVCLFGRAASVPQILLWGCLMSFFNLGAWGVVYAYTTELYPTRVRATGVGAAAGFGRIGGFIAPVAVGLLVPLIGQARLMELNAVLLMMGALVVVLLGRETKNLMLEKISD